MVMQIVQIPLWLFVTATVALLVCLLIQAFVFLGLFLAARTALAKAETLATNASSKALPILEQIRFILEDLAPKIRAITANAVEISATARDQAKHVNSTVDDVVEKTRGQAARVDEMVTAALTGVAHAASTLQEGVRKPARRVSSMVEELRHKVEDVRSEVRSKVEEFRTRSRRPSTPPYAASSSSQAYRASVVSEDLGTPDTLYSEAAPRRPAV
jgi:methyl-accepting chemotaxis protein